MVGGHGLLLPGLMSRKNGICNSFSEYSTSYSGSHVGEKGLGTKLRGQISAIHMEHAHGTLFTDIVRMLQTTVNWPRNTLVCLPSLSQELQRYEAKYRIYYLRDHDSGSILS